MAVSLSSRLPSGIATRCRRLWSRDRDALVDWSRWRGISPPTPRCGA